jgi:hypothetical protein
MKTIIRAALAAAVVLGSASAHAELYKFRMKGTVVYNSGAYLDAPVGTPVTGEFIYDTNTQPDYVQDDEDYDVAAYSIGRKYSFKLQFGEHVLKAVESAARITDGVPDRQLDVFDLSSGQASRFDGTLCTGSCLFSITLVASPDHANALTSVALPSTLNLKRFDRERYGYVIADSAQGPALQFSVDSIKSGPCLNGTDPRTACDD